MNDLVPPASAPLPNSSLPSLPVYQVRISGRLNESWTDWFDGMKIAYEPTTDETLLTGTFADQSALHGMLSKLRDLQLNLVELHRLNANGES
jgi:hypothetical protein